MNVGRFWVTALVAAVALALALRFLFPYGALGIDGLVERDRAWLLTLWTSGVMAICFGASGLLAAFTPIGFKDVAEAGSVVAAVSARREAAERQGGVGFYNFAGWTISAGAFLVLLYFAAWIVIGG
jgi:hypothetical protein